MLNQLRKAQADTNDRLDALVTAQERTNELLVILLDLIQAAISRSTRPNLLDG
jgi:hypothetical protein